MRILFLYPRKLDGKTSVGGVAEFLYALTPALHALGIEAYVYAGDKSAREISGPLKLAPGLTVYHGPFIKPGLFVSPHKLKPILKLCDQLKIDVTHAQGTYTAGFLARQIFKKRGIPYVVTSHSDVSPRNSQRINRSNVKKRCEKVLQDAAVVTHLTPDMEAHSQRISDTQSKNVLIGNGIHLKEWDAYHLLPEQDYMLGIGRLERGKGFHVLIDMYSELIKKNIETSLIIAGKGGAEIELQTQARDLGLNVLVNFSDFNDIPKRSVIFTGYVRGDDKSRLIAQSKCVMFPTQPALWEEAFPIVHLETMAAGRPMVASDIGVIRYLQSFGLSVLVVTPDDIKAWTDATEQLLGDEGRRYEMGANNAKTARQFDWSLIASKYKEVYQQAKSSRKS